MPAATIVLTAGRIGHVIGREGATIKTLAAMSGVRRVAKKDDRTLMVVADDEASFDGIIERVRNLVTEAEGTLVLPSGKNGLLIGRQGTTVNALKENTGIRHARAIDNSPTWRITAPTVEAIQKFAQLAADQVPGTTLTAINVAGIEQIDRL